MPGKAEGRWGQAILTARSEESLPITQELRTKAGPSHLVLIYKIEPTSQYPTLTSFLIPLHAMLTTRHLCPLLLGQSTFM